MAQPEALFNAAGQQPAGGPHKVTARDQLAPGCRIHLIVVHANDATAYAGYVDVKMIGDLKEDWKTLIAAIKAYVKEVVPRGERISRAVKLETLLLSTMDLAAGAVPPSGNHPVLTEFTPAAMLNKMFHHPKMVDRVDAVVVHGLLNPLLGIPGILAPAKALVITSVTHPGVVVAKDRFKKVGPIITAVLVFSLGLGGI